MNASELKRKIEQARPESRFFSRENMKFAGDTMANFGVREALIFTGFAEVVVWELYRKKPTSKGLSRSFYFRKETYGSVYRRPR